MNAVYRHLLLGQHFKGNEIKRLDVCEALNINDREFRYQTADIQAHASYKINYNSNGVYLCGIEELQKLRQRAINGIRREVAKVKEFDKILGLEGQVSIDDNLELYIKTYGGHDEH
jgi:hypothetical protein